MTNHTDLAEQAKEIMVKAASQRRMITYSQIANQLGGGLKPNDERLWNLLTEASKLLTNVSGNQNLQKTGILSAVVVHKQGDMIPGKGFYDLAAEYGRDAKDKDKCFLDELKTVYAYWEKHNKVA